MDLEAGQPWPAELKTAGTFDLALMIRYTNLPLITQAKELLKPGGYLIVEAHRITDEDVAGPTARGFGWRPARFGTRPPVMKSIDYRESIVEDPDGRRVALARMLARRPAITARPGE